MKILIKLLVVLIFIVNPAFSQGSENFTFLYINGSNNNDAKMKEWYVKGVNKLHPVIKRKFERNSTVKKWTKDNKLVIAEKPEIFFWGYDSKTDLDYVKDRLNLSKGYSSLLAYEIRSLMTQFLHDAIWVQKDHNMLPILDELNTRIQNLADNNQNVMLYGYSAGTFVTYQYLLYKLPYINLEKLFGVLGVDDDFMNFLKENPKNDTCLSALLYDKGNIGVLTSGGHLVLNQNTDVLKENYLKLDDATNLYCAPKDRVRAVVNFASPLPLFYSDIADESYEFNFYTQNMLRYVIENGMYFMTVNFREDPLGFPSNRNLTLPQIENVLEVKFENPSGIIYDNSKIWSKRSAFVAHTSYWSARGTFAKSIVKSFVNGTKFLYDEKYQNKVIRRKSDPEAVYSN